MIRRWLDAVGGLNLAVQSAVAAELLCLLIVFIALVDGGPSLPILVALGGVALFTVGLIGGFGLTTAAGIGSTALASALATDPSAERPVALLAIGIAATAALVAADGSWWLRRDARVEPTVFATIGRRLVPAWVIGSVMAVAATMFTMDTDADWTIWLLPAAIVVAAILIVATGWVITHGRPPSARTDLRHRHTPDTSGVGPGDLRADGPGPP